MLNSILHSSVLKFWPVSATFFPPFFFHYITMDPLIDVHISVPLSSWIYIPFSVLFLCICMLFYGDDAHQEKRLHKGIREYVVRIAPKLGLNIQVLLVTLYLPWTARFQKNLKSMFWKYVKSRQWSPLAEAKSMHQIWVSWYFHSRYATWQERSFSRSHFRRRGPTSGMQGSKYATNRLLSASRRSTAAVRLRFRDYWRRRRRQV